ncbi:hypothetical protein [Nocardiopsis sp. NRRL B-16309]|uniref:hypothetical protein n=1 Tax=Nocardiopsis sp. NRRL B-16309 TaxID=1519494 RepID=UPI0006B00C9F|nr:hypothetical protein [Nocardiopsis sp. NRRL B-16309]
MHTDTHDETDAPPGADETEIPEPTPLPETESTPGAPETGGGQNDDQDETGEGPPPLPPLLETGASTLATAGSGIYAATGAAGLVAAAGIATVAGVAYGVSRARATRAGAAGSRAGAARSGRGAAGAGRGGRFLGSGGGGLSGRTARGAGRGAGAGSRAGAGLGAAGGRHRSAAGGLAGASRSGAGRGAGGLGRGSSPAGRGGSRSSGGGSLLGGGSSSAGRRGSGRRGSGTSRGGGGGLLGGGGAYRGRSGGGRGRSGRGGGLFGPGAGSAARSSRRRGRGRSTSIIDPATGRSRTGASRGRLRRGLRAGWTHPRMRRARAITRRGWSRGRTRIRSHTKRLSSYLRKRKWVLRMRGWRRGLWDWFGGLWASLLGRARDPRYGPMRGWQLGIAAAAIGALGAGGKKSTPRPPLVGRIIGTAAPVPGDGPFVMAGRTIFALTTGEEKETPLAPEVQRVRDAAQEIQDALAALGGSAVGMLAYEQGLKELGPTLAAIADGVKNMATTAEDEQPLDGSVLEFFGTIEDAARGASEVAEELPGLFRAAHEVELDRLENPRNNEQKWDVSQQD